MFINLKKQIKAKNLNKNNVDNKRKNKIIKFRVVEKIL